MVSVALKLSLFLVSAFIVALLGELPASSVNSLPDQDNWQRYTHEADELCKHGHFDQAEQCYRSALMEAKKFPASDLRLSDTLEDLGIVLVNEGKYAQAEQAYNLCLQHREQLLGTEHALVAVVLQRLSDLYMKENKADLAVPCLMREVLILEKRYGAKHRYLSLPLTKLARAQDQAGIYSMAAKSATRALLIRQACLGEDNPCLSEEMTLLATIFAHERQIPEAEHYFQRAVAVAETGFNSDDPALVEPLKKLATMYVERQEYDKAEPLLARALKISDKQAKISCLTRVEILTLLLMSYASQKKLDDADKINELLCKAAPGCQEYGLARWQKLELEYGMTYYGKADYVHAEQVLSRALSLGQPVVNETLASVYGALGVCRMNAQDFKGAAKYFQQMITVGRLFPGPGRLVLGAALSGLACVSAKSGDMKTAGTAYAEAIPIFLQSPTHPVAKDCFSVYAEYLRKLGRSEDAKKFQELASAH